MLHSVYGQVLGIVTPFSPKWSAGVVSLEHLKDAFPPSNFNFLNELFETQVSTCFQ